MDEVIDREDRFYILAGAAPADGRTLVLKDGETFAIFNSQGDIDNRFGTSQGLFCNGMRHISMLRLLIDGQRLILLGSTITEDNTRVMVDLTNPDESVHGHLTLPRGMLHVLRSTYLCGNGAFERITVSSFAPHPVDVTLAISFKSDFADIFEVRGVERERRGELLEPLITDRTVVLSYLGLDGVTRQTRIECDPNPHVMTENEIQFHAALEPRSRASFDLTIGCEPGYAAPTPKYRDNLICRRETIRLALSDYCKVDSLNRSLTQWLRRSYSDIEMLITHTEEGLYPYAGVPWFSTAFGRDGIITAMQLLWVNPQIARGVLRYLAATQATDEDSERDAQPGKILHERRSNEMAVTGEVPFGKYYGSVDSTPLFVVLAGDYFARTGDLEFIESIWPNIQRALEWIDQHGDSDRDGFVEYHRQCPDGLTNQGWKDSHDSVFHADGSLATGPIALCEVQGYAYAAKHRAAALATALGFTELANAYSEQSSSLKELFNREFWLEDIGTYALALDGDKQPCAVRTSNAGQCLLTGIADPQHAMRVCKLMMSRPMHSGWGIRTVASNELRYNPMSYHNGSLWPHDNAMIAAGLCMHGCREDALKLFNGWLSASTFFDLHRLPELCCGFRRQAGRGPTLYPVACSPQAWAAGAVFMMLAACLGLSIDGIRQQVHIHRPQLPKGVNELRLRDLRIGDHLLDLRFQRHKDDVGVLVQRKTGPVEVVVTK